MKIIFCQDPITEGEPDSMYIDEVAAATRAGLPFELIDYEPLAEHNNAARAVRDIAVRQPVEPAIYRGWMLRADQYTALYDALLSRGIRLINDAQQYRHVHHLPESLPLIEAHTPRTVFFHTDGKRLAYEAIMQMLIPFAGQPLILKDFVKSEKHYWWEACYIASASDEGAVHDTVSHFLKLRGDDLEGGLVFRQFVEFKSLAEHPRSKMPLVKEYRRVFLDGQPIMTLRYWDVDGYTEQDAPPDDLFADVAASVKNRFFTMDVAQREDGEWMIIELGDGQVAGMPQNADLDHLYRAFAKL